MRKKVVFVTNSLGFGGAERVLLELLEASGPGQGGNWEVHLILLDRQAEIRSVPDLVTKHVLDGRGRLVRSIRLLHRTLRSLEPDLIVSFLVRANVASALCARGLGVPVIISERMHLSSHLEGKYRGAKLQFARAAARFAYRFATGAVGVSSEVSEDLVGSFAVDRSRVHTIFNPFDLAAIRRAAAEDPPFALPDRFIVAAGRLEPSKNFHQLLEAFASAGLPHHLVILGEGTERASLERTSAALGIGDRVLLPGYVPNPFPIVGRAEFYVSSSRNEGFPNAMVEAMALGRAIVSTDCRSGPSEILAGTARRNSPGVAECDHGMLVEENSVAALAEALRRMSRLRVRHAYGARAAARVESLGLEEARDRYWALFSAAAKTS